MAATEYRKLTIVIWLLVVAVTGFVWGPGAWRGTGWETDDAMRLVQARDLLAGQSWRDLTQHRLNPPDGTAMHWSRLPDVPIAAVALALSPVLGADDALAAAAIILPPLYFLLLLLPFARANRLLVGATGSPVALLVAIWGSISVAQFVPGHVDHHGLQLALVMQSLALLLFGLAERRWRGAIVLAGIPFGLSIWVGAETGPLAGAWFIALGLAWCRRGGDLALRGAAAAGLGALIALAALLTSAPLTDLWAARCDALSLVPVTGMGAIAGGFGVLHLLGRRTERPLPRLALGMLCGAAAALGFATLLPHCLGGYDTALDPVIERHWLQHVAEARSIGDQLATAPLKAIGMLWTPLLGLAYCGWRLIHGGGRRRALWAAITVMLACPLLLMFWQLRAVNFAQAVALLPLAALVASLWQSLRHRPRWLRVTAMPAILLVCSAVFWPAVELGIGRLQAGPATVSHGSAARMAGRAACRSRAPIAALASDRPGLILSYIDLGPGLLFATPHAVLGAPYHRNEAGLKETIELFRETDDHAIRARLIARRVNWIVTCPGLEERLVYRTESGAGLAERLAAGRVPDFLVPFSASARPGFRLYRVLAD